MDQKDVSKRNIRSYEDFKKDMDKFQKGGDSNRTEMEKDLAKAHPGYHKIEAEPLFTKHDSNIYKASGIEVDKKFDNSNDYIKPGLTKPQVNTDKEQEAAEGYLRTAGADTSANGGITEAEKTFEGNIFTYESYLNENAYEEEEEEKEEEPIEEGEETEEEEETEAIEESDETDEEDIKKGAQEEDSVQEGEETEEDEEEEMVEEAEETEEEEEEIDEAEESEEDEEEEMVEEAEETEEEEEETEEEEEEEIDEAKKPSAGLSAKKKSAIVKKAKKGGDIGKKGKNFKKVEAKAKAAGAKDPKAVAASAMWKNAKR